VAVAAFVENVLQIGHGQRSHEEDANHDGGHTVECDNPREADDGGGDEPHSQSDHCHYRPMTNTGTTVTVAARSRTRASA
jgi:hypothetical protein